MYFAMDVIERIKELMKKKGIETVWQLSKLSGVPPTTLDGMLNRGARTNGPRIDTLEKICAGLGLTLIEFLSGVEPVETTMAEKHKINPEEFTELIKLYHDESFMQAVRFIKSLDERTRDIIIKAVELTKNS